jgi:hypothetical protein
VHNEHSASGDPGRDVRFFPELVLVLFFEFDNFADCSPREKNIPVNQLLLVLADESIEGFSPHRKQIPCN